MKLKCQPCQGKGGQTKQAGRFTFFVTCFQCKGKGKWYSNQPGKRDHATKRS